MAESYSETRLILCEGQSDNEFFSHIIERRVIRGFQVVAPAGGQTGFAKRLRSIRSSPDFGKLKAILIVSDNDGNPKESFKRVTDQIDDAGGYGVPLKRRTPKRTKGHPAVLVLMLP